MASNTLGIGTATFITGYGVRHQPVAEAGRLITLAVERGIRYIDTAAGYGPAESALGAVSEVLQAASVRVATKTPRSDLGALSESLRRLRVSSVDTLLLHSATDDDLLDPEVGDFFSNAKAKGLIRLGGASTYGVASARAALQQPWCDVVQVEHSILNPSVVPALEPFRRSGQEVVVRSVLCKGLLTDSRNDFRGLDERGAAMLDRLASLAASWELTLAQLAIAFAINTDGADVVLVGIASERELDDAIAAAGRTLDVSQMKALEAYDASGETWTHPERWAEVK